MAEWRGLWECAEGHREYGDGQSCAWRFYEVDTPIGTPPRVCGLPVHSYEQRQGDPWAQLARLRAALERIASQAEKTQAWMRRVGWKYEDAEDMDQKVAFSAYSDLVEASEWARAALAQTEEVQRG